MWQPIATAPKDKPIIVFDKASGSQRVAFFAKAVEDGSTAWVYARSLSCDPAGAIAFVVREPTHWMPLPEPPV